MMTSFSPEIVLLNIIKKCRDQLLEDILNENPVLYATLYSNKDSELYRIYQERYDLIWLKSHWDLISEYITVHKLSAVQKGQLLSQFAKWYCDFIECNHLNIFTKNENVCLMREMINLKIDTLESIIEFDKRCNDNMLRIETSFMKSLKIMNDKINNMKSERK